MLTGRQQERSLTGGKGPPRSRTPPPQLAYVSGLQPPPKSSDTISFFPHFLDIACPCP